ncbi:hypothetical protein GQX73_g6990 [Xylaria multiplex]|uniref:Xylanolytic transcriptional activator regulatory domain-containing protein n=1 Tax=Xylaria multiplex TaxID=323545 RepID=A0A7C8IU96_9PEZI|nr:hypothetical protein GQX73_g6990 [Xylaria multiplex]
MAPSVDVKRAKYARQVRCDRSQPCSNCRASGIACQQAIPRSDTGPKAADRITQLERHIELLEDRLSVFERQRNDSVATTALSRFIPTPATITTENEPRISSLASNNLYQGNSSFAALSAEAGEAVQTSTLSNTSDTTQNIDESFHNLNNLIHIESTESSLSDHYFSPAPSRQLTSLQEALPVSLVVSILRKLKARGSIFLHGYMISDVTLIEDLCRRVCFPTDPVSTGLVNSMHGLLYILLRECLILGDPLAEDYDLKEYISRCGRNFNTGIETYDILAVPSFENVLSLTLGVVKAQNEAKLFLARTLASAAASHCHILGYHREKLYQSDRTTVSHTMRRLFWSLYVFDKNMSLILGRTSSFQDIEIDAQYPPLSTDQGRKPWDEWFHLAIRLAKVQGQIYDRLYSAAGIQTEVSERRRHIESLEAVLHHWRTDLEQINSTHVNYPEVFNLSRAHWDIMYYSTLTCLLRASATPTSGGEISSQCFQAARSSLKGHLFCFSRYNSSNMLSDADFANWLAPIPQHPVQLAIDTSRVLHTSSFTPFIVIFLHAIAATSIEDLDLLDEVVQTLRSTRQAGRPFERLYELCATFARLARRLVEGAQPCVGAYNQGTDSLQLPEEAGQMPVYWLESLQNPDVMSDEFANVSTIFADWMNGQPSVADIPSNNSGYV